MKMKRIFLLSIILIFISILFAACAQPPLHEEPMPFDPDMPPGEEPPPGEPPPGEPPPGEPPHNEPPPGQPQQPQPANPQPQPANPQPQQPQNQPQGQCQSNWHVDLAVTDIFADNQPIGEVFVRVTNHGPCTMSNINSTFDLLISLKNHTNNTYSNDTKEVYVIYNMAPGETQTFPTGYQIDTGTYNYSVVCYLGTGGMNDPNKNNDQLKEQIQ